LPSRADDYAKVLTVVLGLCAVGYYWLLGIHGVDFTAFWTAGRLSLEGRAQAAYEPVAMHVAERSASLADGFPFLNPPPFLLVVTPLALMPHWLALAVWTLGQFVAFLFVARRLMPGASWLLAALPAGFMSIAVGQNGHLTSALFLGAMLCLDKRPFLAGFLIGCLVIKPQLALLIPVALIASGRWRAFASAAVTSVGLLSVSELLFPGTLQGFLTQAGYTAHVTLEPGVVGALQSVYGAVARGGSQLVAGIAQGVATLVAAACVWSAWRGECDTVTKAAALAAATPLATPYLFDYDLVLLALPLYLVAQRRPWLAGAIYLAPLFLRAVSVQAGLALGPLAFMALLWAALHLQRERKVVVLKRRRPGATRPEVGRPS
jgi:hypothetical protein